MKTKATRFKVILIAIVFSLIGKMSIAQNWQCYITNDHLTSPTVFEYDVYIKQTSGTDTLLRTFQGCFTFNAAFINGATITASYVVGSTQMLNYGPGAVTWSAAANGFQIAANTGVACSNGTPILGNGTPKLIGTYRLVATAGAFGCAPPNPNMAITGDVASGLALRMAVTKWLDITCVLGTNTSLTSGNIAYTRFASQTQYTLVNNFVRSITASATSTPSCVNTGTASSSYTPLSTFAGEVITYLWSNGGTTQNITNLVPNTYSVTITNQNGCSSTASAVVGAVVVNATVNTTPSCGATGSATADVTPPGTYTYLWSNGGSSITISNLAPGTYTVTVTDQGGCSGTASGLVGDASFTASANSTPSCTGDGTAGALPATAGFSYLWSNSATTANISNLTPGTYTVTVTNQQTTCTATASTTVLNGAITAGATSTPSCGVAAPTGTAAASSIPATGVTYLWNTGATTQNLTLLPPGTYTVTVTNDIGNCTATATTTVGGPVTAGATATPSCGQNNGTATATPGAGVTYLWSNGGSAVTISSLSPGTYTVTVTITGGCTSSATAVVGGPVTASITPTASCGTNNGSANVTTNPVSGVSFIWSTGATTTPISNLAPGTYTITVTNNSGGCTVTATTVIGGPVTAGATATPSCGNNNGSATATPASGVTYLWSTSATTNPISNLAPGTYTVTVTNISGGCSASATAVVGAPVTASITPTASCGNNNGSANVTSTPPTGVTYVWSTGATTNPLNNLAPGTYTVTVTNSAGGCTVTATTVIGGPVTASASSTASCGQNNGTATANPASGVSYVWSTGSTARIISNLSPGTYTVTVTGIPGGCTATATTTVGSPVTAGATSSPSCVPLNGTATATPASGVTYVWSTGATTASISSLAPGSYTVTVTNIIGGCTSTASTTVGGPVVAGATSTPSCNGNNGTATATPASGVTYSWSNGASTQIITGLTPGTYTVFVSSSAGCSATASTTVGGSLVVGATATESCGTNGTATATPPGLSYLWSNGGTTQTILNLVPGNYSVTVTGAGGCTGTAGTTVSFAGIVATATSTGASCAGGDGTASAGPSGNIYVWSNGATDQNITGLNAGTYTVTVSNQSGCTSTASTTVASSTITATATSTDATCAGNDGTASAGPSGNTYLWSNGASTQTLSGLAPGTYTVTVTTSTQCTGSASTTVGTSGGSNNPPGPISGPILVCKGQHGVVYCITPVPGATSYVWTLPNGASGVSNGPCITLNFNSHWSTGQLCVSSVSSCGTSPQSCLTLIRVNSAPSTPGNISGPSSLCPNTCATYSIAAIANASSYEWSVTGGAYINSGQGTNTVEICAPFGYTGGTISVKAKNCKGTSAKKTKSISGAPGKPVWYNKNKGDNDVVGVCAGSIHEYEIYLIPGVNCYIWTAPPGAVINDRAGHTGNPLTTTGTVDDVDITFPTPFTSGYVTVAACGPCGPGVEAVLFVQSTPSAPSAISGWTTGVCGSGTRNYSVPPVIGATSYQWTLPSGVTMISGSSTRSILVRFSNSFVSGDICVTAKNKCGYSDPTCITVDGLPLTPGLIFGHTSVCRTQTYVQYSVPAVQGAQSYIWTIDNGAQIVNGAGTRTIRVKYTNTTVSPVTLSVVADAPCGSSSPSTITINVNMNCKTSSPDGSITEDQTPVMHSFIAYPNPTTGKTTVSFDAVKESKVTVKVSDVLGNVLLLDMIPAVEGYNMKEINLEDFSAGLYFVSVQVDGEQMQTLRLIVN